MTPKYLEPGEFWSCPNCEHWTYDSEEAEAGHTPDAYSYLCENCGCAYGVDVERVQHGLSGWRLSVEEPGDFSKSIHDDKDWWKEL